RGGPPGRRFKEGIAEPISRLLAARISARMTGTSRRPALAKASGSPSPAFRLEADPSEVFQADRNAPDAIPDALAAVGSYRSTRPAESQRLSVRACRSRRGKGSAGEFASRKRFLQIGNALVRDRAGQVDRAQFFEFLEVLQPGVRHLGIDEAEVPQLLELLEILQPRVRHPGVTEVEQLQLLEFLEILQPRVRHLGV